MDIQSSYVNSSTINVGGGYDAAGFIGYTGSGAVNIFKSYITGADVVGNTAPAGGFIGNNGSSVNISSSYIKSSSFSNNNTMGGFVGGSGTDTITNSYFMGSVSSQQLGYPTAGAIAYGTLNSTNVYTVATVNSGTSNHYCFGGSYGGSINNSYYDNTVCTLGDNHATGRSTSDMKTNGSAYSGWNLNSGGNDANPWCWTSGDYPCLYWESGCTCS